MSFDSFNQDSYRSTVVVLSFCAGASQITSQHSQKVNTTPVTAMLPIDQARIDQFAEAYIAIEKNYIETAEALEVAQAGSDTVIVGAEERVIRGNRGEWIETG